MIYSGITDRLRAFLPASLLLRLGARRPEAAADVAASAGDELTKSPSTQEQP